MLKRLCLYNFQPWKKLVLDLDPGVNVFVGPTDTGKSSIFRALYWLCRGKPLRNDFMRWGASKFGVKVEVDGHVIKRRKGQGGNYYELDGRRMEGDISRIVVPDEVAAVLNIDELSFQSQFEPYYLFQQTPGQVSKELNRIINLDLIDRTLGNLATSQRQAKAAVALTGERLAAARERKQALAWAPVAQERLERLATLEASIQTQRQNRAKVALILQELTKTRLQQDQAANAVLCGKRLLSEASVILAKKGKLGKLQELIRDIQKANKEAKEIIPHKALERLGRLAAGIAANRQLRAKITGVLGQLQTLWAEQWEAEKSYTATSRELQKLASGRVCPLCLKPMSLRSA